MVVVDRAIMSAPSILLVDEPSPGLSLPLCRELFRAFGDIRSQGVGIFLIEQNSRQSLAIADRGYPQAGWSVGADTAGNLLADEAVGSSHLGTGKG